MGLFAFLKRNSNKSISSKTNSVTIARSSDAVEWQNDIVPIEKRIKGQEPTCDGLYPHEVLVLSYAPRYCYGENEYPKFWWYKYGISDVSKILTGFQQKGLICVGGIFDAIYMEKLPVIKEELKKHGLKTTGKKDDLVNLLVDNVKEDELSLVFTRRPYVLTAEGKIVLKRYEWIPYIHSHEIDGLDIWNLTEMVQASSRVKYRDRIWGHLNKLSMRYMKSGDWGLFRNVRFKMSEFLMEENKIHDSLSLLCEVVSFDLSGLTNGFKMEHLYMYANGYFPYETSVVKVAPGVISRINKQAVTLGFNEEQLREFLLGKMKEGSLLFQLFTPEERVDIFFFETEKDTASLKRIYHSAEKRFQREYRNFLRNPI